MNSKGLAYYRIVLSFLVLKNAIFYLPMADELFGRNGIVPMSLYITQSQRYLNFFPYVPFQHLFVPQLFLIIVFVVASLYLFGKWRLVTGLLLYYLIIVTKQRNGFIMDGSDNVIQVTLPFLILAESLQENKLKNSIWTSKFKDWVNGDLFLLALKIQICFVYFFTAVAKLQGQLWLNGTAIYYTMRVDEFRVTEWNIPLTENHYFVVLATYFTIIFEMAFPFLIWFKRTKFYIIFAGVLLHLGIWIFMRIDNFSWIMIGSYLIFIQNNEYEKLYSLISGEKLFVYFDMWCPKCKKTASFLKKIDFLGNIKYLSIRNNENANIIDVERGFQEMPSVFVSKKQIVHYGFDSLVNISRTLPVIWIFYPLMFILKITGLGKILYKELAENRKIIRCTPNDCQM